MKRICLTENAVKNHEELSPNHESKLQRTDPEFIELFDNWAFDEVIRQSKMDTRTRVLMILASTIASQALGEYKVMLRAALNAGLTPVEIKEVLYQSVPYVGVAKVFDFLHATNDVLQNGGLSLPLEGQATTTPETRFDNGVAVQKAIFGELIDKMRQQSPEDELHIQDFLSANCFGDYYTRNGLDVRTREM
ncbi:MAG TPA: carboxymuconolactone decarboxylase family protein, partial [Dongiaceae bacterium]|nr:carboxymuconolactone decarboxylase family protein [Dongiaceae bacterium]